MSAERDAFDKHLDEHGCGCPNRPCLDPRHYTDGRHTSFRGFAYCDEAMRLAAKVPSDELGAPS